MALRLTMERDSCLVQGYSGTCPWAVGLMPEVDGDAVQSNQSADCQNSGFFLALALGSMEMDDLALPHISSPASLRLVVVLTDVVPYQGLDM
jgi:hypothetical protein